jgi:hypothetical protein
MKRHDRQLQKRHRRLRMMQWLRQRSSQQDGYGHAGWWMRENYRKAKLVKNRMGYE